MQFTTTEEHAALVERARALLSHASPAASLGELHLRAMRLLVELLEKKRFGSEKIGQPRRQAQARTLRKSQEPREPEPMKETQAPGTPEQLEGLEEIQGPQEPEPTKETRAPRELEEPLESRARCRRYVPARQRRAVYERDGRCCAYVDERGARCGETHHLEIHHLHAFARGGGHALGNLALRCRAHNGLAAEQDFGRAHVERQWGKLP
jgi:5-methylcytosine-specific restriction endonuclease McrA